MKITNIFVKKESSLDVEIREVTNMLRDTEPYSDDYEILIGRLESLYGLKAIMVKDQISPDTKALIFTNLVGIGLILGYEKFNVLTSKAFALVAKTRV